MVKATLPTRRTALALLAGAAIAGSTDGMAQTFAAAPSPTPPGRARIWIYRILLPDDTMGMPLVAINRAPAGYAEPGTRFCRDVPAGPVEVTVDTYRTGLFRPAAAIVAPGQEVYVQIVSEPTFEDYGNRGAFRRGTYYAALMPPQIAALQLAQTRFTGGA